MKKLLISLAFVFAAAVSASAQWYAGGMIAGAIEKNSTSKAWGVNFRPEAGYILGNRLAVGGRISYGKANTAIVGPGVNYSSATTNAFTINPYAAWGLTHFGSLVFGVEGGIDFTFDQTLLVAYIVPILAYPLSENVLLRSSLDFAGFIAETDFDDYNGIGIGVGTLGAVKPANLSIGFVYKF